MKTKIFTILVLSTLLLSAISIGMTNAQDVQNPRPELEINVLAPNSNPARNTWSKLMTEELPKIGIGVSEYENVGWDIIGPRTFSYPATADTGIPTAEDGGYDLFFVGLSGNLDYNPFFSYHTGGYSPSGNNFAFYKNTEVDDLIDTYISELDAAARLPTAKSIQGIVAEELPYIPLINTEVLWSYGSDLSFTDGEILMLGTSNLIDGWKDFDTSDHTLNYAHSYELTEFMPEVIQSYIAAQYTSPIFQGLYERTLTDDNPNYLYQPMIAKDMPEWSDDGLVANVTIRDDVVFSNGNPLTAYDVENSFQMHMTEEFGSVVYAGLVSFLENDTSVDASGDFSGAVVALDDYTVQFRFENPYFLGINLMASPILTDMSIIGTPDDPKGGLLPDETTNSTTGAEWQFNQYPEHYAISTGPFVYSSTDPVAGSVELVPNENYWNGEAKLDKITFTKFGDKAAAIEAVQATGDNHVDIIDAQFYPEISEIEEIDAIKYTAIANGGVQMMSINMGHPILGTGVDTPLGQEDPTKAAEAANYVRLAISHITPRNTIVDEILKGLGSPGTSLWPDLAAGYDDTLEPHPYDLAKAREYMVKAGYVRVTETDYLPLDITSLFLGLFSMGIAAVILRKKE